MKNKRCWSRLLATTVLILSSLLMFCRWSGAQEIVRGTITGTVTADQGEVRGFRVTAHNLQYKLWYTVFTVKGHYTIPQALPGVYDITVLEGGYESPTQTVQLGPGENKTAEFAVKKRVARQQASNAPSTQTEEVPTFGPAAPALDTVWVDTMDQFYPAGPGRELLKENCTGCHGAQFGVMHMTKEGYRAGIARMTETGPTDTAYAINLGRTPLTGAEKEQIAEYLAANFGPDIPDKRLRVDPLVVDENATAKSIYVSYDTPSDMPRSWTRGYKMGENMVDGVEPDAPMGGNPANNYLHDPFITSDGLIWYGAPVANAMMSLNPREAEPSKRWKIYPVKGSPYVFIHGITADKEGRMYWAEITGGRLGELDPKTGKQIRYYTPERGAMLQVATDQKDNIWFGMVKGGSMGYLEARTRRIHQFPTPTPDNGIYGLAVAPDGSVWGAGWQKGTMTRFNPETDSITEYKPPSAWGQIRRIGVDSKGIVWGSEHNVGIIASLDPASGKITEYKLPLKGSNPYDIWPDKDDNLWIADMAHSTLIKFEPGSKNFTYYPEPQLHWSLPKLEIEKNNTLWFGARGVPHITANHFYPNGYTADAPPEP